MLKTLLVWITVLFLRRFGVNVNRKKLATHGKRYARPDMTRIERRVHNIAPPACPTTIVVPDAVAKTAQRVHRSSFGSSQETGPWVLCPNYDGRDYLPNAPAVAKKPVHAKQSESPPLYRPTVEESGNRQGQARSIKKMPKTVSLYSRRGDTVVPVMMH